jgi:hypothetical protein
MCWTPSFKSLTRFGFNSERRLQSALGVPGFSPVPGGI